MHSFHRKLTNRGIHFQVINCYWSILYSLDLWIPARRSVLDCFIRKGLTHLPTDTKMYNMQAQSISHWEVSCSKIWKTTRNSLTHHMHSSHRSWKSKPRALPEPPTLTKAEMLRFMLQVVDGSNGVRIASRWCSHFFVKMSITKI